MSKKANLRICASCELIYKNTEHEICPYCGFGASYGARWAVGDRCYREYITRKNWKKKVSYSFILKIEKMMLDKSAEPVYHRNIHIDSIGDLLHRKVEVPMMHSAEQKPVKVIL